MKTCTKCNESKLLDEFHRDGSKPDGRLSQCKPCKRELNRQWHADNRELASERNRRWYAESPGYVRQLRSEKVRQWKTENPHAGWESLYRIRARKYGFAPVLESFTRDELIDRYGDACVHCGGPFEQLDHYPEPVALGGAHTLDNCVPSCADCNRGQVADIKRAKAAA